MRLAIDNITIMEYYAYKFNAAAKILTFYMMCVV